MFLKTEFLFPLKKTKPTEIKDFRAFTFLRKAKALKMVVCLFVLKRGYGVAWNILSGLGPDDPGSNPGSPIPEKKMVTKEKPLGSVKRFGARYGRTVRFRLATIEAEQRKRHKCPYCNVERVKRVAVGIWNCRKCGAKFTGKAYSPVKRIVTKAEVGEEEKNTEGKEGKKEEKAKE